MTTKRGVGFAAILAALSGACSDDGVEPTGAGGAGGAPTGSGGGQTSSGTGGAPNCLGTETDDPQLAAALEVLREEMVAAGVPGGAIAIVKDGQVLGLGVSGSKSAVGCDPITTDTLFGAAFLTELVTTVAVLDAVEEGKLALEAPITNFIPEPGIWVQPGRGDVDQITLHHLLTNTSGYRSASSANPLQSTCTSLADAFENAVDPVIQAAPGTMNDTNDWNNFEIAGLALQNVDGVDFGDAVAARVLGPLGMGGTFDHEVLATSDHSKSYVGSLEVPLESHCPNHAPALGYHGSIDDLATLVADVTGGVSAVLGPAMQTELFVEQGVNFWSYWYTPYGISQAFPAPSIQPPDEVFWTDGLAQGFTSHFVFLKQRGLAVVTLMNGEGWEEALEVTERVLEMYDPSVTLDLWPSDPNAVFEPLDPTLLASLVGSYHDEFGFDGVSPRTLDVTLDPNDATKLVATLTSVDGFAVPVSLAPHFCNHNYVATVGSQEVPVRFWRDETTGEPSAVQLFADAGPPLFRVP